jgi:hypothetical protein
MLKATPLSRVPRGTKELVKLRVNNKILFVDYIYISSFRHQNGPLVRSHISCKKDFRGILFYKLIRYRNRYI